MRAIALAVALGACLTLAAADSGLEKGASVPVFNPDHLSGPLKGTNACPT